MSDLCLICYTNPLPKDRALKCGFKVCEFCLISWVKAEAKYEFIKAGDLNRSVEDAINKQQKANYSTIIETLKCVNNDCQKGDDGIGENAPQDIKHRLTYEEVVEYVQHSDRADYKEDLDKVLFDILTPNTRNLIKCPRQGCDYVGYLNIGRKCTEQLECEKCNYSWSDPNLDPFCKKLRKCCCSWNLNFSLINDLQKVLRSQACPGCGICIIKDKGCKHMVCQSCKYEFCWFCLGHYPGYQHKDVLFCRLRSILKFILYCYIFLFTINLKFCIMYNEYRDICIDASEIVGTLILSNILALSCLFEYLFIGISDALGRNYGSISSIIGSFFRLISFIYPVSWIAGIITMLVMFKFVQKLAVYFCLELVSISVIICTVLLLKCIWKCLFSKIRQMRARRQYRLLLLE